MVSKVCEGLYGICILKLKHRIKSDRKYSMFYIHIQNMLKKIAIDFENISYISDFNFSSYSFKLPT